MLFIAKLNNAKGRFLLSGEKGQGGFDGWKIHDARQAKYGNKPDLEAERSFLRKLTSKKGE